LPEGYRILTTTNKSPIHLTFKTPPQTGEFFLPVAIIQNVKRNLEVAMIICSIFFIALLFILFVASAVENLFTGDGLAGMGGSLAYT